MASRESSPRYTLVTEPDLYTIVTIYNGPNGRIVHAYDTFETRVAANKEARAMRRELKGHDVEIKVVRVLRRGIEYA